MPKNPATPISGSIVHPKHCPFKPGDKVRYLDGDTRFFYVVEVYSPTEVSLCLHGYPTYEQDYLTSIYDIRKVGKHK